MTLLKSILGAAIVAPMAFSALAQDAKPITWWYESLTPEQQTILQDTLVKGFNDNHPGQQLQLDFRGNAVDNQQRVALMSGSGPDIINTPGPASVTIMAKAGQLLALDDYAAQYGWTDRLLPLFLNLGTVDGKLYSVAKNYEAMGLFYNPEFFAENGWEAPKTIDELETIADAMIAKGIIPFASGNAGWRPANEQYFTTALNALAGPDAIYKALTGEIAWTDPVFVEAVTRFKQWWDKGYFGKDYFSTSTPDAFAQMVTGQTGMSPTGTWAFSWVKDYFTSAGKEAAFASFPTGEGIAYPLFPLGVGSTFSINAKSANAEGAAEVIDYVFSPEFYGQITPQWQGEWNIPLADLSGVTMAGDVSPLYTASMDLIADAVADGNYGYTTWTFWPPATQQYIISGIEEVWLNTVSVEDFLAQVDATFKTEVAEGKLPPTPAR